MPQMGFVSATVQFLQAPIPFTLPCCTTAPFKVSAEVRYSCTYIPANLGDGYSATIKGSGDVLLLVEK